MSMKVELQDIATKFTSDLNPPQAEAVLHTEGPLLLLAGAGSGKTRVLTRRIAYILASGKASRQQILAVTFTNKAAREMAERVASLCGPGRFPNLGTFHSVCSRWLRSYGQAIGLDPAFTIYAGSEQQILIKEAVKELNLDPQKYKPNSILAKISSWKSQLIDPVRARMESPFSYQNLVAVYESYQKKLTQNRALDFDDILTKAVELFRTQEDIRENFQKRLRYLCVDEYQDVNPVQYELIRLLAAPTNNICAVGDDDQSIYAFRGADISILLRFEKDFPQAKMIRLEQNYRSTQYILEAANHVVAHNQGRKRKNLWTDKVGGYKLGFFRAADGREEGSFVANSIYRLARGNEKRALSDFVVLYRTNAQSRLIEEAMIQANLPYQIVGGLRFFERKEIKDALSYLRLLSNLSDSVSLRRVINEPARGVGSRSIEKLLDFADLEGMTLFASLERCREAGVGGKAALALEHFFSWVQELVELVHGSKPYKVTEVLESVLERSGYLDALRAERSIEAQARIENLHELFNVTEEFDRNHDDESYSLGRLEGGEGGALETFLVEVSLLTDQDRLQEEQERVTLMTLHSAKGLEYPIVFLTGMEEETLPHLRSMDNPSEMEEERRLCYVGITRARERLFLSAAAARQVHGSIFVKKVSRFVQEIPAELFEQARIEPSSSAASTAIGSSRWKGFGQTVSSGASTGNATSGLPAFVAGEQVMHRTFGKGTVVSLDQSAQLATVDFHSGTRRKLKSSFLTRSQ